MILEKLKNSIKKLAKFKNLGVDKIDLKSIPKIKFLKNDNDDKFEKLIIFLKVKKLI